MNILFFSHYFPPEGNAPATRTYEHCKHWAALGHNVTVVTCAPNAPEGVLYDGYKNRFRTQDIIDGIRVIRLWTYIAPNRGFLRRTLNYLSYMLSAVISALCTSQHVDIIIATSPQFFCGLAGVLAHWFKKWPLLLEIRDLWPESILVVGAMRRSTFIPILERLEKVMYRAASHIIAVNDGIRRGIIERGISPERISVIPNGVDLQFYCPSPQTQGIREELHSAGKFVCAYIGTVGMAHGLEVIIKAAELCLEKGEEDIVFWVVGDGAARRDLESLAKKCKLKNVIFTGRIPKIKIPKVISACDACLVHLRDFRLFNTAVPSKIFELMAMNVPIIMGVRGEARRLVHEADAGLAMTPENPQSLISCLYEIRNRGRKAFSGPDYVALNYNRQIFAQEMLCILEKYAA